MNLSIKKNFYIYLLPLLSVVSSPFIKAKAGDLEKHTTFGLIDNLDKVMTPMTGGAVGAVSAGVPGAILGVCIGALDEGLIYLEYFDSPHLTAGLMGAAVLSPLKLSHHFSNVL
jgi:hypothetical protein